MRTEREQQKSGACSGVVKRHKARPKEATELELETRERDSYLLWEKVSNTHRRRLVGQLQEARPASSGLQSLYLLVIVSTIFYR